MLYRASSVVLSSYTIKENISRLSVEDYEPQSSIFEHSFDNNISDEVVKLFTNINYYFYNYIGSETKKIGPILEEIEDILGENSGLKKFLMRTNIEPVFGLTDDGEIDATNKVGEVEKKYLIASNLDVVKGVFTKVMHKKLIESKQDIDSFIAQLQ